MTALFMDDDEPEATEALFAVHIRTSDNSDWNLTEYKPEGPDTFYWARVGSSARPLTWPRVEAEQVLAVARDAYSEDYYDLRIVRVP